MSLTAAATAGAGNDFPTREHPDMMSASEGEGLHGKPDIVKEVEGIL